MNLYSGVGADNNAHPAGSAFPARIIGRFYAFYIQLFLYLYKAVRAVNYAEVTALTLRFIDLYLCHNISLIYDLLLYISILKIPLTGNPNSLDNLSYNYIANSLGCQVML